MRSGVHDGRGAQASPPPSAIPATPPWLPAVPLAAVPSGTATSTASIAPVTSTSGAAAVSAWPSGLPSVLKPHKNPFDIQGSAVALPVASGQTSGWRNGLHSIGWVSSSFAPATCGWVPIHSPVS